jgi:hypothetical protein
MKHFQTIEKLDTAILYILELASSLSIILLAFGLIASMANVLTKGSVLTDNLIMQRIWAWTQCIAIDASVAGTILRTFKAYTEGEKIKAGLYTLLSALLLFTAAIVSNIEAVQQTLNITLEAAYIHVFIPVELLIWIRSIAIVLLIVAHAMRHVQIAKPQAEIPAVQQAMQPASFTVTPELVETLRTLLAEVTVSEVREEPLQLAETTSVTSSVTAPGDEQAKDIPLNQLAALLPTVTQEEIAAVVSAYKEGVQRRNICGHLRWGTGKYTTIVKPVLDAYAQMQQHTRS